MKINWQARDNNTMHVKTADRSDIEYVRSMSDMIRLIDAHTERHFAYMLKRGILTPPRVEAG